MNEKVELLRKKDITEYIEVIKSIFGYETSKESVEKMIDCNKIFIIRKAKKIVATVTIEKKYEYVKQKKYYYISYLGVLKEERRNGYATKLFEKIDELAKENNIDYLELTSGNHRRAAHLFYKNKNFKLKDTTVFIKI